MMNYINWVIATFNMFNNSWLNTRKMLKEKQKLKTKISYTNILMCVLVT